MATVKAQEKFVIVNGVRLRYLDWGTDGKTLKLVLQNLYLVTLWVQLQFMKLFTV